MKVVFNFLFLAALTVGLLAAPSTASADRYYSTKGVLKSFFPNSDKISYVTFTPTAAQRKTIESRLGQRLGRGSYNFFVAKTAGRVDGYAFIDDERGQHQPITFAVKLTTDGVIERQEVMAYRERWGGEIRQRRFRKQFEGKSIGDSCRAGRDIHVISGATISSHAMARGVRRALVLFDIAIGARAATRTAAAG